MNVRVCVHVCVCSVARLALRLHVAGDQQSEDENVKGVICSLTEKLK